MVFPALASMCTTQKLAYVCTLTFHFPFVRMFCCDDKECVVGSSSSAQSLCECFVQFDSCILSYITMVLLRAKHSTLPIDLIRKLSNCTVLWTSDSQNQLFSFLSFLTYYGSQPECGGGGYISVTAHYLKLVWQPISHPADLSKPVLTVEMATVVAW